MADKRRLTDEDITELYDLATSQLREDRSSVNEIFEELREFVKDHPTRYVELGETITKLIDLKMKQTSQVIDVFKVIEKAVPDDNFGSLNPSDLDMIEREIRESTESKIKAKEKKKDKEKNGD